MPGCQDIEMLTAEAEWVISAGVTQKAAGAISTAAVTHSHPPCGRFQLELPVGAAAAG